LEIDFDKLLDDFVEKYNENNPNQDNDKLIAFSNANAKFIARICVSILRDYEALKRAQ